MASVAALGFGGAALSPGLGEEQLASLLRDRGRCLVSREAACGSRRRR